MGNIKNAKRFAELERIMGDYFSSHIVPVMQSTKDKLANKQVDEMRDYGRSLAGILSFGAASQMPGGDPYQTLKVTGKWNSKTTEDYILMCKQRLLGQYRRRKECHRGVFKDRRKQGADHLYALGQYRREARGCG